MWPIAMVNGRKNFQRFWSEAPWKPASHAHIRHTWLWFSHHFIQLPVLFHWFCSSVIKQHILKFFRYCNGSKNSSSRQSCTRWDARSGGRNPVWGADCNSLSTIKKACSRTKRLQASIYSVSRRTVCNYRERIREIWPTAYQEKVVPKFQIMVNKAAS